MLGAGGHARVVAEALGVERLAGFLSPDEEPAFVAGLGRRLGCDDDAEALIAGGRRVAIGLGFVDRTGARRRAALVQRFDDDVVQTVVHPHALIAPTASLGAGAFVAAGAIIGTDVRIARTAIVNSGAVLDHDVNLGGNVHVGPGAVLSGFVSVGDDSLVGVGSTIRQGVRIGNRAVVGAGAVVIDDVADDVTVVGVPARPVGAR